MGAGIAQVGAQTGHKVTLVDLNKEVSLIISIAIQDRRLIFSEDSLYH